MELTLYQVDAFATEVFRGNPAAVMPLRRWFDDERLQALAVENNLSETAFLVPHGEDFELRWFTPAAEIDLCGHATLASAFVLFTRLQPGRERVTFHTRSGPLTVEREGERLVMDFPARPATPCEAPDGLAKALGRAPAAVLRARDLLAVYEREDEVRGLVPDFTAILALGVHGVIVTAPGGDVDFVSRFFAPKMGVPEDPVTGSAHCTLAPYWAERLGRTTLRARQVSKRTGEVACELRGDRVRLGGGAVLYLEGTVRL